MGWYEQLPKKEQRYYKTQFDKIERMSCVFTSILSKTTGSTAFFAIMLDDAKIGNLHVDNFASFRKSFRGTHYLRDFFEWETLKMLIDHGWCNESHPMKVTIRAKMAKDLTCGRQKISPQPCQGVEFKR